MLMTAATEPAAIAPEELAPIRALYEEGLCLRAYERAKHLGPLRQWRGTQARILAGSLAAHLGSPRLGTAIHIRAWREAPTDPETCLYYAYEVLSRRGPLAAWEFLREVGPLRDAEDKIRGYWLSLHTVGAAGYALTVVARHRAAIRWMSDWEQREDAQPWMLINLAIALRAHRRVAEAHRVSLRALELGVDYTSPYHRIWLALDDLIDGDGQGAAGRLDGIDPESLDMTNRYLYKLARILLERREADPTRRAEVLKSTGASLARITSEAVIPPDDHLAVVRTYRRVTRRMAADRGRIAGFLWWFSRELRAPRMGR